MLRVQGVNFTTESLEYLNKINTDFEKEFKIKIGKSKIINALIEVCKKYEHTNLSEIKNAVKKHIFKKTIFKKYKTLGKIQSEIKNLENEIK